MLKFEGSKLDRGLAQAPQLPKAFCGHEGVLECSGLAELWMGIERDDGKIQSGVKPPQSKKQGSGISREGAEGWDRVPQLPKTFCGHEGVLECSGLAELGMGWIAPMGEIQSGVQPPQSKKQGSGISRGDAKARRVGDRGNAESKGSEWRVAGGGWRVAGGGSWVREGAPA
jgi:hypothetical protein